MRRSTRPRSLPPPLARIRPTCTSTSSATAPRSSPPGVRSALSELADLRVLTFGAFVAGNTAALILAELGMDVVKIESRVRPEALRYNYFFDHPDVLEPSGAPTTALYGG